MIYILTGGPATGKGTRSDILADAFNIPHISTGDMFREQIKNETQWSNVFQLPTTDKPYAWKRTIIGYTGIAEADKKSVYEIVIADIAEINQSLYIAMDNTKTPRIYYPQAYKEDNTSYNNLQASITNIIDETKKKDNFFKQDKIPA